MFKDKVFGKVEFRSIFLTKVPTERQKKLKWVAWYADHGGEQILLRARRCRLLADPERLMGTCDIIPSRI